MHGGRRRFIFVVALLVGAWVLTSLPIFAAPFQPGQIFIAYGGSNIGVFADTVSLAGTQVQTLSVSPSSFTTATTLSGGGGIALDEFGNLYVTVQNFEGTMDRRGIIKIDRNGNVAWKADSGGTLDYRGIVASSSLDRVFVATEGGSGQRGIHVYRASDGEKLTAEFFGGTLAFRDLAFDKNGNLYAVRQTAPAAGNRLVIRRWSAGNYTGTGSVVFAIGGTYANSDPRALVVDDEGNIYIALNSPKAVIKVRPAPTGSDSETSDTGTVLATYTAPSGTGTLIGLDYDPGVQKLFASHTGGIGQILALDPKTGSWTAFGPNNLSGVRWLAVYPTPEPTIAILLAAGWLFLRRRSRR